MGTAEFREPINREMAPPNEMDRNTGERKPAKRKIFDKWVGARTRDL
jgi:hypothetical protein